MASERVNPVRFGTDGWRAIIAEDFTFENVRACAQAIALHFRETYGTERHVVVGFDTRFLSQEFAAEVARVIAANGFPVELADRPAPTPALSWRIIETGACGGVVVTSSHNPAHWNGIKVKPPYGGSASPEIVADIGRRVPAILEAGPVTMAASNDGLVRGFDPIPGYLDALSSQLDLAAIRSAGLELAFDPMYGAGAGIFSELLAGGSTRVTEIHTERNPAFPGIRAPEPIEPNLGELLSLVAGGRFDAAIANDGDADRVGLVDEHGVFVDQLRSFALIIYYLLGIRGLRGPVVRSITTTNMANLLGEHFGVRVHETPVGFKHIGPLMMSEDALVGGEESGGYGFRGHLPERDGILAGLYLLDAVARSGKRPAELLADVFAITGEHFYERVDYDLEPGSNAHVKERLDAAAPRELAGRPVVSSDRTDGWRFHVPEGWLLLRLSGTEPLLRVYTEVREKRLVRPLLAAGAAMAGITGKA